MQVAQYETTKEVWESIKVRYIGEERVQKAQLQTLRSELKTLKMKDNETVSDFARKLRSIRGKFKSLGSTLKDKTLVRKLLNSVSKKFLPIVASIEQYSEIDEMSFEEAMGRIITFEEQGEQSKNKMRCYNCGEFGHLAYECTKLKKKAKNEVSHLIYETDDEPTLL
ncbi:zinc finger, CCHC-type containing protein [Tanacetum coccineum]